MSDRAPKGSDWEPGFGDEQAKIVSTDCAGRSDQPATGVRRKIRASFPAAVGSPRPAPLAPHPASGYPRTTGKVPIPPASRAVQPAIQRRTRPRARACSGVCWLGMFGSWQNMIIQAHNYQHDSQGGLNDCPRLIPQVIYPAHSGRPEKGHTGSYATLPQRRDRSYPPPLSLLGRRFVRMVVVIGGEGGGGKIHGSHNPSASALARRSTPSPRPLGPASA